MRSVYISPDKLAVHAPKPCLCNLGDLVSLARYDKPSMRCLTPSAAYVTPSFRNFPGRQCACQDARVSTAGPLPSYSLPFAGRSDVRWSSHQARATFSTELHPTEAQTSTTDSAWNNFCEHAAGEWEGATATFSADGKPCELPSQYVPQEFNDWNVTLYDWQSQCSMQPQATGIKCLLKRIMPTVGCEADAQSFNEEERQLFGLSVPRTEGHQAILSDGSYTTASSLNLSSETSIRFEHCLVTAKQQRIRVVQHVTALSASDPWKLASVEVHNEKYDAPYNGGASLSGCGGGMSNFAEGAKLDIQQLQNERKATSGRSYSVLEDGKLQLQDLPERISGSEFDGITCLPLNTYSIVQSDQHGGLFVEAGVLQNDKCLRVAQQKFVDGHCSAMILGCESSA